MSSFVDRVVGAARLDPRIYEEVETDTTATPQAMGVVVLAAVSSGIGAATLGATGAVTTIVGALVGWVVWAALIWLVGTKVLPEPRTRSDIGELLRTIGFASSPGLLLVLRIIPLVGLLVGLVVWIWQLAATVVAVRQALDYTSTGRAVLVCAIGWVINIAVSLGIALMFGITSVALG
jgi:Yip1 domain